MFKKKTYQPTKKKKLKHDNSEKENNNKEEKKNDNKGKRYNINDMYSFILYIPQYFIRRTFLFSTNFSFYFLYMYYVLKRQEII